MFRSINNDGRAEFIVPNDTAARGNKPLGVMLLGLHATGTNNQDDDIP